MLPDSLKLYSTEVISKIVYQNHESILAEFYEMQSNFLSARYKMNKSIETTNILTLLGRNLHLEIFRQRERDLNFDISLSNFLKINHFLENNNYGERAGLKIVSIVESTGIPKETVRRKLNKLVEDKVIKFDKKNKIYFYNLTQRNTELYKNFIEADIKSVARFVMSIAKYLNLNLKTKYVENEIKSQFSFYYYHFYNSQIAWMRMWQKEIKDVDLIFITIQALIPTLKSSSKNDKYKNEVNDQNFHSLIGKGSVDYRKDPGTINASSISEVSGIPRATCIRKLQKLVKLGMLVKEVNTKRYYVNQTASERAKFITKKENILSTINIFSDLLSILISALSSKSK
tara:strand:+ start:2066 stop:3097 length:1032 start_codon:yes stop_codon:yes gene_type:complete